MVITMVLGAPGSGKTTITPVIDSTGLLPAETARQLAKFVRRQEPGPPDGRAPEAAAP